MLIGVLGIGCLDVGDGQHRVQLMVPAARRASLLQGSLDRSDHAA